MATRTKEEERLLDEKIARIQKKNEEILKREKEIEEDKRLAARQNAIVQLRSTTSNDSRERTPALRPSKRESFNNPEAGDSVENFPKYTETTPLRGRGGRRGRDRTDRMDDGPPPDPRSYLADSERDPFPSPRDGRGDERGMRGDERGSSRGGREFQRGGRRGRGRPERGRGRNEDAWRAERNRIDEERIQRQKSSDGGWRREWDSEKIEQELDEESHGANRSGPNARFDRWKSNYSQTSPRGGGEFEFDSRHNRGSRGARVNRSRLNDYDQHYLDRTVSPPSREQHHFEGKSPHLARHSPGDREHHYEGKSSHSPRYNAGDREQHFVGKSPRYHTDDHFIRGKKSLSPRRSREEPILVRQISNPLASEKTQFKEDVGIVRTIDNGTPKTILKFPTAPERSVIDVGGSFKVLVSNTDMGSESVTAVNKTPRRPNNDMRHRHKSQNSYSSQSEDENLMPPRERGYRGGKNRIYGQSPNQSFNKNDTSHHVKPVNRKFDTDISNLPASNKPPLPPFKSNTVSQNNTQDLSKEPEDEEESWEDVTTSGTESIGEDMSSAYSSPYKVQNTFDENSSMNENIASDMYTPEDFLIMQQYDPNQEQSDLYQEETNKEMKISSEIDSNIVNFYINESTDELVTKGDGDEKIEENVDGVEKIISANVECTEQKVNENVEDNLECSKENIEDVKCIEKKMEEDCIKEKVEHKGEENIDLEKTIHRNSEEAKEDINENEDKAALNINRENIKNHPDTKESDNRDKQCDFKSDETPAKKDTDKVEAEPEIKPLDDSNAITSNKVTIE